MQKVTDPRDGIAKLLEINPRLGQRLCWRAPLGVNEPMICLDIVRGLSPKGNLHFPEGVLLLDLYHAIFFCTLRSSKL